MLHCCCSRGWTCTKSDRNLSAKHDEDNMVNRASQRKTNTQPVFPLCWKARCLLTQQVEPTRLSFVPERKVQVNRRMRQILLNHSYMPLENRFVHTRGSCMRPSASGRWSCWLLKKLTMFWYANNSNHLCCTEQTSQTDISKPGQIKSAWLHTARRKQGF